MLGAVDSMLERESEEEEPLPQLASWRGAVLQRKGSETKLTGMPFEAATKLFEERAILPRPLFDQLTDAAKKKAFTVAGLAAEELLADAHAELARQIRDSKDKTFFDENTGKWVYRGPNLREFDKFARDRLEKAGWTPANPSHIETVFRTNVMGAYGSGRIIETTQPSVIASRPYWQIVGVNDSRQRPTHRKAHGTILSADNPFWRKAYPPFGYGCRCRVITRSKRWVDKHGGPTRVPDGLPDPGFASGIDASLVPMVDVPSEGQRQPEPAKAPHPIERPSPVPSLPQPAPEKGKPFTPTGALAPIEAPKPPTNPPPAKEATEIMRQIVAGPGGSNPGGVYVGSDGVKRYVKLYSDPAQAAGEHLANKIYGDLGLGKVKSQLFELNGKTAYASQFIDGATPIGQMTLTRELAADSMKGLVGDLVTANWDAAGLSLDNLVAVDGRVLRIDNGGTFLMRAQAGRKPTALLNQLTEWDGFFDPAINPTYAKLAQTAGVSRAADMLPEIKSQLQRLQSVAEDAGGWAKYVTKHAAGLAAEDASAIAEMLESRTKQIAAKVAEAEAAARAAARATEAGRRVTIDQLAPELLPTRVVVPGTKAGDMAGERIFEETLKFRAKTRERAIATMTNEERLSIHFYTEDGYDSIRAATRLTKEEYDQANRFGHWPSYDQAKLHSERINTAIDKARAAALPAEKKVTEVYRGIKELSQETFESLLNAPVHTWPEPTSTSWNPGPAARFYGGDSENSATQYAVYFRIKRARNSGSAAIEGISGIASENEFLFKSGAKFRTVKVTRDEQFPRGAIVYLEEIP